MKILEFLTNLSIIVFLDIIVFIALIYVLNFYIAHTPIQENIIYSCENNITWKIEHIAEKIADAQNYTIYKYDCTNYANDLAKNLSQLGINAYCISGLYICEPYGVHTWVEILLENEMIEIEATKGYIVDNQTYINCYKPILKSYCL